LLKALNFLRAGRRRNAGRSGAVAAVDMDGQTLRVVNAVPRGSRMAVTRIAAEPLDLPANADRSDPEVMGKAIAKALDKSRIKPRAVVMGVPRASVVLRTLTLPFIKDVGQLAAMVHLQVSKDLPFRVDEAVIDFKVRPQSAAVQPAEPDETSDDADAEEATSAAPPAPPKLEVLVGIVRREVVDFYQKLAVAADFKLVALGLLPYGNARCVEACHVADGEEGVAIVTLRPDEVGIDVVVQDSLLFSRGAAIKPRTEASEAAILPPMVSLAPTSTAPDAEAEDAAAPDKPDTFVEAVNIEVVRSLHSYGGMDPSRPVAKVVVAGATGHEQAVVENLSGRLNIPCRVLDVVKSLHLPQAASGHAAGSLSGIGLGLGVNDARGLPFDFLNPKRPAQPRNTRRTMLLLGAAALVGLMVCVIGLRSYLIGKRVELRTRLQNELVQAKKPRPVYRQMRQQFTTIQGWMQGSHNWLEHYAYLSAVLPPSEEIYITSISISGQGAIRLSVQAQSGAILAKLDKQLRSAGYEVKPLAINPGPDRFGYEFRSAVELIVPEKLKIDLTKVRPPARLPDDASLDAVPRKGGS
jgi:Tfp pilus assembly PilM family ATPase